MGMGRGYSHWYGWYPPAAGPFYAADTADEIDMLKEQADYMRNSLDAINKRIDALNKKSAEPA